MARMRGGARNAGRAAARRDLREQAARDRDVVEVAEDILQRGEAFDIRPRRCAGERRGEEVAGVAQALHADAQAVTLPGIAPVDVLRLGERLAVQPSERRCGEQAERAFGLLRPALPRAVVYPAQRPQQESLQTG